MPLNLKVAGMKFVPRNVREWDQFFRGQVTVTPDDDSVGAIQLENDAVTTLKIIDDAVTLAKMAEIVTSRLLGRITAGSGNPEVLTGVQAGPMIAAGYNDQVAAASQAVAEAGTEAAIRRFSPLRIAQAIEALRPSAFGCIDVADNAVETAIASSGVAVQVTIFGNDGASKETTPDHTEDHIIIDSAGTYFIAVSASINSVSGAASRFEFTVKKNDGDSTIIPHVDRNLGGGGGESGVISLSGIAVLADTDTIECWIENESNTQNYIVENISLTVLQIAKA